MMNYNEYNEVINGENTYEYISKELLDGKSIGIGWTDEMYTHLDLVFKLGLDDKHGIFQRGIRQDYLFVGIMSYTCYAFRVDEIKMGSYIQDKLRLENECGDKLAELINNVIKRIIEVRSNE